MMMKMTTRSVTEKTSLTRATVRQTRTQTRGATGLEIPGQWPHDKPAAWAVKDFSSTGSEELQENSVRLALWEAGRLPGALPNLRHDSKRYLVNFGATATLRLKELIWTA